MQGFPGPASVDLQQTVSNGADSPLGEIAVVPFPTYVTVRLSGAGSASRCGSGTVGGGRGLLNRRTSRYLWKNFGPGAGTWAEHGTGHHGYGHRKGVGVAVHEPIPALLQELFRGRAPRSRHSNHEPQENLAEGTCAFDSGRSGSGSLLPDPGRKSPPVRVGPHGTCRDEATGSRFFQRNAIRKGVLTRWRWWMPGPEPRIRRTAHPVR